jgi:hypothetical protein
MDLKTVSKPITSETSAITIGGQVAAGMKRWVTFLAVDTALVNAVEQGTVYLASVGVSNPTKASIIATGNRKAIYPMEGTQLSRASKRRPILVPAGGPDPENPVFSIAGGKWLAAWSSVTTANVFIQYFDE